MYVHYLNNLDCLNINPARMDKKILLVEHEAHVVSFIKKGLSMVEQDCNSFMKEHTH